MTNHADLGLEYVETSDARGETAEIYEDIRRTLQIPFVPNAMQSLSAAPAILAAYWALYRTLISRISLPHSLVSMVLYSVASSNDCMYCTSWNELHCRTYGIDEETLYAMTRDLPNLTPERVRTIIEFALKVSHDPKSVNRADVDVLRDNGMSDEEIVELIMISAVGQMNDILADTLKIDLESTVVEGLALAKAG